MCDIELETCEVFEDKRVRARLQYVCDSCGGEIEPGKLYTKHTSLFGGEWHHEKMCSPCEYTMRSFAKKHRRCNPSYLEEALAECVDWEGDSAVWWWTKALSAMRQRRSRRLARARAGIGS